MSGLSKKPWPNVAEIHTIIFDFDGVFTDNKVYVTEDGHESVCCDRRDGLGIEFLRHYRDKKFKLLDFFIVSTERNPVVAERAKKLRIEFWQDVGNKLAFIESYLAKRNINRGNLFSGLVYLGNDLNDLEVMKNAGFSIAPNDAHPKIKAIASVVLLENGGHGFVRSAIEKLFQINDMTLEEIHEFISNR